MYEARYRKARKNVCHMGRPGVDSCNGIPKEIPLLSNSYKEGVGLDNCDICNSTVTYLQIKKSGKRPLSLKEKKMRKMYCAPPYFCS